MKLQGSPPSSREILQSQISPSGENRIPFNRLAVVHGRLKTAKFATLFFGKIRCAWAAKFDISSSSVSRAVISDGYETPENAMPTTDTKTTRIGAIPLKSGDEIRVEITEFCGRWYVNLRRWYINDDGELKPTPTGINVAIEHLPALNSLVRKARKRAERDGLLPKKKVK